MPSLQWQRSNRFMFKFAILLSLIAGLASATTSIKVPEVSATQAIIWITTDQGGLGSCTIRANEGTTLGAPYVNDVNTTLFTGSNLDSRPGSVLVGSIHKFVLGLRDGQVSPSDNRRYSRALRNTTAHIVGVTCGGDAEVTSKFQTANPDTGVTFQDRRFSRIADGQFGDYNYPSMFWSTRNQEVIDPTNGTKSILGTLPGDIMPYSQAETFMPNFTAGTGWACVGQACSYSGTSQGYVYLPAALLSITSGSAPLPTAYGTPPGAIGSNADWATLTATLSGTAGTVKVYLTANGITPIGAAITQAITGTPTTYTIGTQVPVFESWRSGPNPPVIAQDIVRAQMVVTKSGTTVTWNSGTTFRPQDLTAGSYIYIGTSFCPIASITSDQVLTLVSSACIADGSYAAAVANFGFLIQAGSAAAGTITLATGPTWTLGSSGIPAMPASGEFLGICSPVSTNGPGSIPGNLCSPAGGYGPPNEYGGANPIYWISTTGIANVIGVAYAPIPTGLHAAYISGDFVFDGLVGGRWYGTTPQAGLFSNNGLYRVDYSGSNATVVPNFDTPLTNATSTTLTTDISARVAAFDVAGNFAAYETFVGGTPNWAVAGWATNGTNGALVLRSRVSQDYPAWFAVWSLDTNDIIAAYGTYTGLSGTPNRWSGEHTNVVAFQYAYNVDTVSSAVNGVGGAYGVATTGTLGPAPWSTCPANAFGASGANCSTLTLATLTPTDPGGNSLAGQTILNGDYMQFNTECVRIVALSGFSAAVFRNQYTAFADGGSCGGSTSHSANLRANMFTSAQVETWWAFATDPHGLALTVDPTSSDCHYTFNLNTDVLGCVSGTFHNVVGKPIRLGALPANITATPFVVNHDATFSTSTPITNDNCIQTHPSNGQYAASTYDQGHYLDNRPYFKCGTPSAGVTAVGTYVYMVPAANLPNMNYRVRQWEVTSGTKIAADISGPSSALHDTIADNYKFCYTLIAGECFAGSVAGQTYVNFPFVSQMSSSSCASAGATNPVKNDISIDEWQFTMQGVLEGDTTEGWSPTGQSLRLVTTGFAPACAENLFWNSRELAPGGFIWTTIDLLNNAQSQALLVTKPPMPPQHASNNNTYIPLTIKVAGVTGDVDTLQWGYGEYDQGQLATSSIPPCHSRNETCNSVASGTQPFVWSSETQLPTSCSSGCTLTANIAPAPGGRAVYYRIVKVNGSSTVNGQMDVKLVK